MNRSLVSFALTAAVLAACGGGAKLQLRRDPPADARLARQCEEFIGAPRVLEPAPGVYTAVGYDLANMILVHTDDGNVVVDTGMSPVRAKEAKAALLARSPGPIRAVVFTHSHIDHVGGASAWIEPGTEIWATENFRDHFLKQYALFQRAEMRRGAAQFGEHVPPALLACSALGRRIDLDAARETGVRLPTKTFTGEASFTVGGTEFKLVEAHGETHDQLFVWIPSRKAILSGDNFYYSFPNLYTIRGTAPRPVDDWIRSLDKMRALEPEALVPSHTIPVTGAANIQTVLTDYRDAIQWVRDETVRAANAGEPVDAVAARIRLPADLADKPYLDEMYGQLDWSVRAIFDSNLGWFDGRPETLYPLAPTAAAAREVALMGGESRVREAADAAMQAKDFRWAVHLYAKLRDAGVPAETLDPKLAAAYYALGETVRNTNGRGYLLESAYRAQGHPAGGAMGRPDDVLLASIPVDTFLDVMAVRLIPDKAAGVHETLAIRFADIDTTFYVTVRRGVAEVHKGAPLPGTPAPVATIKTDTMTWRKLALQIDSPALAVASGRLKVDGSLSDVVGFLDRFDKEL